MDPKRGLKSTGSLSPKLGAKPEPKGGAAASPLPQRSTAFQDAFERLERDIHQLRVDFERFFNGALPFPPEEQRNRVHNHLRYLRNVSGMGVAESFQLGNIEARFNSYNELFNRRMRDLEEGRKKVVHLPPPPAPAYDPDQGIVLGDRMPEAAVEALYRGLVSSGDGARIDLGSFRAYLGKQIDAIRQKTGCSDVQFRLALEDGKLKLKARPLAAAPRG